MTTIILALLLAFEIVFLILDLTSKSRHPKAKAFTRLGLAAILAVLVIIWGDSYFSGFGILAAVLALMGAIGLLRAKKQSERPVKPVGTVLRLIGCMLLYAVLMFPAILFPYYEKPVVTGEHEVLDSTYTWTDESRVETFSDSGENRSVTVKLFYPADKGSYPLVVFSHGAFGMIDSNHSTYVDLASNGYVVAAIAHPYHAIYVEDTEGNVTIADTEFLNQALNGFDDEQKAFDAYDEWMELRSGDINFVLDTLLAKAADGEEVFNMIDGENIGLFGHSMGGAASVEVGRQRDDIDAVVVLEGTMLGEFTDIDAQSGELTYNDESFTIPLLDVNSKKVYDEAKVEFADQEHGYVNFYELENATDGREIIFNDAAHLNFTDLPLVSPILAGMLGTGEVDARECIENVNAMVVEYFGYYLKGEPTLTLPDEY